MKDNSWMNFMGNKNANGQKGKGANVKGANAKGNTVAPKQMNRRTQ